MTSFIMIGAHSNNCFDVVILVCLPGSLACNQCTVYETGLSVDINKGRSCTHPAPLVKRNKVSLANFRGQNGKLGLKCIVLEIKETLVKNIGP